MAKCVKINKPKRVVCIGSMTHLITLQTRAIAPTPLQEPTYNINFSNLINAWAALETTNGGVMFDETGTENIATHIFLIRYIPNLALTSENWILYNNEYYDILRSQNLDEDKRFIKINCRKRGNYVKEVNLR
jgi:SPP1 family predicted phage head-tail adaptor